MINCSLKIPVLSKTINGYQPELITLYHHFKDVDFEVPDIDELSQTTRDISESEQNPNNLGGITFGGDGEDLDEVPPMPRDAFELKQNSNELLNITFGGDGEDLDEVPPMPRDAFELKQNSNELLNITFGSDGEDIFIETPQLTNNSQVADKSTILLDLQYDISLIFHSEEEPKEDFLIMHNYLDDLDREILCDQQAFNNMIAQIFNEEEEDKENLLVRSKCLDDLDKEILAEVAQTSETIDKLNCQQSKLYACFTADNRDTQNRLKSRFIDSDINCNEKCDQTKDCVPSMTI